MISRAYRFRLYPNKEQQEQIEKTFVACRFVWNRCLEMRQAEYDVNKKTMSTTKMCNLITMLKHSGVSPWLADAPVSALQQSVRDLDQAYSNFFRRLRESKENPDDKKPLGFPKYKKAGSHQSYRTPAGGRLDKSTGRYVGQAVAVIDSRHVKLPKLGTVKCRITQMPEGHILSATVRRVPSGKYFCSITCKDVPDPEMPEGSLDVMGVRFGVRDVITCSDGVKVKNQRTYANVERKLRREKRKLSRRVGARKNERKSANFLKQKRKVARIEERAANQRRDNIHKATTRIVRDSRAVAASSNKVSEMMRGSRAAKQIADAGMGEAMRQLAYKSEWHQRTFIKVDSSTAFAKTCSRCGAKGEPKLGSSWTCPSCGTRHDYALNAAKNIASIGSMEMMRQKLQ